MYIKAGILGVCFLTVAAPLLAENIQCDGNPETWLEVDVKGFKDRKGILAVELHPDIEGDYLDPLLARKRVPTPTSDPTVCLPLERPGSYILVVLHDRNEDKKLSVLSDGFGFSRNPKIGLSSPDRTEVAFTTEKGKNQQTVILNYVQGLTAKPIDPEKQEQQDKRRRARRR